MSEGKLVVAKVVVSLHEDGMIGIDLPEDVQNISYEAVEDILRRAYQRMMENRIIASTVNTVLQVQAQEAEQNKGE